MKRRRWQRRIFLAVAGILIIMQSVTVCAQSGRNVGMMEFVLQKCAFESFLTEFLPRDFWCGMGGVKGRQVRLDGMRWFAGQMASKQQAEGMERQTEDATPQAEKTGSQMEDATPQAEETEPGMEMQAEEAAGESEESMQVQEIIFAGDSRVVGMASVGGYCYVGEVGIGYYWLSGEGAGWMAQAMADHPDAAVVLCFGINDLGNIGSYIGYYQYLLDAYPDRQFYFMSVNPVEEGTAAANGYSVTNAMVEQFNASLMESFPNRYIDVYGYLMAGGFGTTDGIHYDAATYAAIQNYTLLMVNVYDMA